MGMRAGLNDYNDTWYKVVTENDPTFDVSPYVIAILLSVTGVRVHELTSFVVVNSFDLLHTLDKTWVCPPGTCGRYASPGFELLVRWLTFFLFCLFFRCILLCV